MNTPIDPLGIDLSDLLEQPGTTTVSSQSLDAGISTYGGIQANSGVEISLDPTGGISAVVEGGIAADGGFDAYGSYDSVDIATNSDTGTTDVSMESVDGIISADAGIEAGGGIGVSLSPGYGGIPELEIVAESGLDAYSDNSMDGSYDTTEVHHQDSSLDLG
ncbi:hypothetical protein [Rhodococcus sp. NPDC058481]|uniref:hypothetical protein n=1 Tax=unclassified Rhodococcus (in: high G+C Gram-positive bacteria) TaxID=192944 RepID=UPI00365AD8D2